MAQLDAVGDEGIGRAKKKQQDSLDIAALEFVFLGVRFVFEKKAGIVVGRRCHFWLTTPSQCYETVF